MSKAVFTKIERLLSLSFVPLLAIIIGVVFVMMKLFGSKYSIYPGYILIFGFFGTLQIINTIYYSVLLTLSKTVYKKYLWYSNIVNAATVTIYLLLVLSKVVSIPYIALALILNNTLITFIMRRLIKDDFCGNLYASCENK